MSQRSWRLLLLLSLLCASPAYAQFPVVPIAAGRYRPDYDWQTVRAGNFLIYYVKGHEAFARRIAQLVPEVATDVDGYLGVEPRLCPLVLSPDDAFFNGNYAPFPSRLTLFETPVSSELTLAYFGTTSSDFADLLFTHEYAHYAHITMQAGPAGFFMRLLGPGFTIPNSFARPWQIEGLATYLETKFTDAGRLRSPLFRAILLAHARDGTMWSYAHAGSPTSRSSPGAGRVYLGGAFFTKYVDDRFGVGTMAKAMQVQASWFFPFTQGGLLHATGLSPNVLYADFVKDLEKAAERDTKAAQALALPEGKAWGKTEHEGDELSLPLWTKEGTLLALRHSLDRVDAVVELGRDGRVRRATPVPHYVEGRINAAGAGAVVFGAAYDVPVAADNAASVDLTVTTLGSGATQRLTHDARLFEGERSPDGKRYVAQRRRGNWLELVLLDPAAPKSATPKVLAGHAGVSYFGPSWSPDGRQILAAAKVEGKTDLVLIDVETGATRTLFAADAAGDLGGRFACGGRYVVFASDRSGLWNVFAFDLRSSTLRQLTSVASAALNPAVSPDCKTLAFDVVTGRGAELRVLPFQPRAGTLIATGKSEPLGNPDLKRVAPETPLPASASPPWSASLPFAHWPFAQVDERGQTLGVILGGADPLYHNFYRFAPFYGVDSRRAGYDLALKNRATWVDLALGAHDGSSFGNALKSETGPTPAETAAKEVPDTRRWLRERGGLVEVAVPLKPRSVPTALQVTPALGMRVRRFSGLRDEVVDPEKDTSVAATASLLVSHAVPTPRRSALIAVADAVRLGVERSERALGTELPGGAFNASLRTGRNLEPFNVGWKAALMHQRQTGPLHYDAANFIPRGYSQTLRADGFDRDRVANASLELHLPLAYPEAGLSWFTLHSTMITAGLFADQGVGWSQDESLSAAWRERRRASGGVQLNFFGHLFAEFFGEQRLTLSFGKRQGGEGFFNLSLGGPLFGPSDDLARK